MRSEDRQRQILQAIREGISEEGQAPTLRQVATAVDLSSPAAVLYHLRHMADAGLITREEGRWRTIRLR